MEYQTDIMCSWPAETGKKGVDEDAWASLVPATLHGGQLIVSSTPRRGSDYQRMGLDTTAPLVNDGVVDNFMSPRMWRKVMKNGTYYLLGFKMCVSIARNDNNRKELHFSHTGTDSAHTSTYYVGATVADIAHELIVWIAYCNHYYGRSESLEEIHKVSKSDRLRVRTLYEFHDLGVYGTLLLDVRNACTMIRKE